MTTRTVITRSSRVDRSSREEFVFTEDMIPELSQYWNGPKFLRDYRAKAWEAFRKHPMPTTRDEAWRRTDLRGMATSTFRLAYMHKKLNEEKSNMPSPPKALLEPLVGEDHGGQIIMGPEGYSIRFDPALAADGIIFTDIETASQQHPDILGKVIGKVVHPDEGKFSALAAALARYGVLVYIPSGVQVERPLHSVLWGPGVNNAYFSHILVWLEDGASLTYVHEAASPTETKGQALHAGIVEIHVGSGANLRFVELQSWGEHVWNVSHERARVSREASLDWIFGAVGSRLTKNFSDLDLVGEGASGRMSGFYFTKGVQHLDHDTQQNHLAQHTSSDLLFKGALKGRSRSVWQGMIYVAPGAQKTDGYQANRNLVLNPEARADSIPGLEILADDVRCTHGATVGKIDPEPLFYLRSRGIPQADAERLIVEGFFDPIMQRIPFDGVRARFQQAISDRLNE